MKRVILSICAILVITISFAQEPDKKTVEQESIIPENIVSIDSEPTLSESTESPSEQLAAENDGSQKEVKQPQEALEEEANEKSKSEVGSEQPAEQKTAKQNEREKAEKERAEREKAKQEKAERERAEKEKAEMLKKLSKEYLWEQVDSLTNKNALIQGEIDSIKMRVSQIVASEFALDSCYLDMPYSQMALSHLEALQKKYVRDSTQVQCKNRIALSNRIDSSIRIKTQLSHCDSILHGNFDEPTFLDVANSLINILENDSLSSIHRSEVIAISEEFVVYMQGLVRFQNFVKEINAERQSGSSAEALMRRYYGVFSRPDSRAQGKTLGQSIKNELLKSPYWKDVLETFIFNLFENPKQRQDIEIEVSKHQKYSQEFLDAYNKLKTYLNEQ